MGLNRGWEEAASMFSRAAVELKTSNPALLETAGKSWDKDINIYPKLPSSLKLFRDSLPFAVVVAATSAFAPPPNHFPFK
ncbi:hypothetical protein JHK87_033997 [Glycine soja]|nr:hypothetical protein JHK87_033997 [Glycine soja]